MSCDWAQLLSTAEPSQACSTLLICDQSWGGAQLRLVELVPELGSIKGLVQALHNQHFIWAQAQMQDQAELINVHLYVGLRKTSQSWLPSLGLRQAYLWWAWAWFLKFDSILSRAPDQVVRIELELGQAQPVYIPLCALVIRIWMRHFQDNFTISSFTMLFPEDNLTTLSPSIDK